MKHVLLGLLVAVLLASGCGERSFTVTAPLVLPPVAKLSISGAASTSHAHSTSSGWRISEYAVNGAPFDLTWVCQNSTAASLYSPTGPSGVTLAGTSASISMGHAWYPKKDQRVKFTLFCINEKKTDSQTITLRHK